MSTNGVADLLRLRNIDTYYGEIHILESLDLNVREGELVSLLGGNASGKSTTLKTILGLVQPRNGSVEFRGEEVTGRTKVGVVRSMLRTPGARREEKEIHRVAEEKLSFFGDRLMGYRWDQPAYSLSYANRRRLEIARAMATQARILLLDEPAAGMNPRETHEITELIGKLRDDGGYTILVIEHDMHVVEGISDRVVALDHGVKIAEGSFEAVATDPRVVEAYLGLRKAETK